MSPAHYGGAFRRLAGGSGVNGARVPRLEPCLVLLIATCFLWIADQAAAAVATKNVLVLYSNSRLVPGNIEVGRGLSEGIMSTPDRRVQIFYEFLDRPFFSGNDYENAVTTYLRQKYSAQPPDAIVAVSESSLDFLLRKRAMLFTQVPLVYIYVSKSYLETVRPFPADVVGVPADLDFLGTIQQALRWHSAATRLVVVTGASARDREWEAKLRREIPPVVGNIQLEFIAAQSTADILSRLGQLGADSIVFTPGYFQDGDGTLSNPRDSTASMAAASSAPVYGPLDTFIGTGVVGGRAPSFLEMGRQGARSVNQLLAGAEPSSLRVPEFTPSALWVDWRQVQRWKIDEKLIPADAIVHFRAPTFWEAYRKEAIVIIAVILLQAGLIAMLLLEHSRRRKAELAVQEQRGELWHASRLAIAGELTASIAHEINQPLGAILTNADAGELLLRSGRDRSEDLRRILADIRRDDMRASDVIRRLRALLAKHDLERQPFDPNETVAEVQNLLRSEAERRRIRLDVKPNLTAARAIGDRIQMQQVVINLVLNAMDAVADVADERRVIALSVENVPNGVRIDVRDRGHGVPPEDLLRLFDSFFSTKRRGMGLGLSIARTIVESHDGRIWCDSTAGEGASFHVELPVHHAERQSVAERA
jgi:signal transduction histidine kinase